MAAERSYLPVGSLVSLGEGGIYRITGEPIGCGGGSILYPACSQSDPGCLPYVLKECYPASGALLTRNEKGEIVPEGDNPEALRYLQRAKLALLEENTVSQQIYRKSSRTLPLRCAAPQVTLTLPGGEPTLVSNAVTVMDSLSEKGHSLSAWLKERRSFTSAEAMRIIQQLLFALREVHEAGFLHLDIQDGNVFLRGTLDDRSELVTLIDFGCARAMDNGKTAPIQDRVIFTTHGFSAPEILHKNDGTLQLGPEADLYSVGCLLLYLLTGQRANPRELQANRSGLFLRPNHLRRIGCPAHLQPSLQQILARALDNDTQRRYRSADEMLRDVSALAEALQPYRTDLSAVKYDAFISYKHNPIDSAAAHALQRALETYRLPRGISPKKRPFTKVFVDEDELSSCADFGQLIREALKNSGWLIVICSPETPLSPWVRQEIDIFLQYHDRSRILAVLTGGDENISFPPQLKSLADGSGEVFAPHAFSATPREAARKLKGDVLLKLAAPMLATTYDTLRQRHRIYKLQRIAAATALAMLAAVGFAAYAADRAHVIAEQARQIEREYENALVNESRYLAEQAKKLLKENDPLGALELSLKALPTEEQPRPVLAEVEYILGEALGLYTTPGAAENTAAPAGIIDTESKYFFLSANGKQLFTWDAVSGLIECWSAEDLTPGWWLEANLICTAPLLSSDGDLFLADLGHLRCLEAETGREKWAVEIDGADGLALSGDGQELMLITENKGNRFCVSVYTCTEGQLLRRTEFEVESPGFLWGDICISPDLRYAALPLADGDNSLWPDLHTLYLVDLQTGDCRQLMESGTEIRALHFLEDRLALIRDGGFSLTTWENVEVEYKYPDVFHTETYALDTGTLLHSREVSGYFDSGNLCRIFPTDYDDGRSTGEALLFVFGDQCLLEDASSGTLIRHYALPSAATALALRDNGFATLNADGSSTSVGFGIDAVVNRRLLGSASSAATIGEGVLFTQHTAPLGRDHRIYKYRLDSHDVSYEPHFTADSQSWQAFTERSADNGAVLLWNENRLALVDTTTGETQTHTIPEEFGFSEYALLGTSRDSRRLYWKNDQKYYAFDFDSGRARELKEPTWPPFSFAAETVFQDESLMMIFPWHENGQSHFSLYHWDLVSGEARELGHWDAESVYESTLYLSLTYAPENGRVSFFLTDDNAGTLTRILSLDCETGESTELPLGVVDSPHLICWDESAARAALLCDGYTLLMDLTDGSVCDIPMEDSAETAVFTPDGAHILQLTMDGRLSKHRTEDGVCLAELELSEVCEDFYAAHAGSWIWNFTEDGTLLAVSDDKAYWMDISGELRLKALIPQCIGYDAERSRFLVAEMYSYSGKGTTIGSFPRYTTEDMIRMARDILNQ